MERQRNRLLSPFILSVFNAIAERGETEATQMRRRRRAFARLGGWFYKPNGVQEVARRVGHIAAGRIKVENGLSLS